MSQKGDIYARGGGARLYRRAQIYKAKKLHACTQYNGTKKKETYLSAFSVSPTSSSIVSINMYNVGYFDDDYGEIKK